MAQTQEVILLQQRRVQAICKRTRYLRSQLQDLLTRELPDLQNQVERATLVPFLDSATRIQVEAAKMWGDAPFRRPA